MIPGIKTCISLTVYDTAGALKHITVLNKRQVIRLYLYTGNSVGVGVYAYAIKDSNKLRNKNLCKHLQTFKLCISKKLIIKKKDWKKKSLTALCKFNPTWSLFNSSDWQIIGINWINTMFPIMKDIFLTIAHPSKNYKFQLKK